MTPLFAALNMLDGKMIGYCMPQHGYLVTKKSFTF